MSSSRTPEARDGSTPKSAESWLVQPPSISLPKGGGAVHGIGEKFGANPVTGSGSMAIPIFASPGRSSFGPQLALSYDSGSGNGPFGLGWSLSIPTITRKTDRGLPQYRGRVEPDVFVLARAEDLVPFLIEQPGGHWTRVSTPQTANGERNLVDRYRPRVERGFALIEWWTHEKTRETHWRTISRDNVTTILGDDAASRITDREDSQRVFSWLISRSYDDKGNVIVYGYKPEDYVGVDFTATHERNRDHKVKGPQRYLKRIQYGNVKPYLPDLRATSASPLPQQWMFELVFDYGDHDVASPLPGEVPSKEWPPRPDPFSTYRPGFEVRTHRLCRRAAAAVIFVSMLLLTGL
jgi:hypothetical protein